MSESFNRRITRREALTWIGAIATAVPLQGCVYPEAPEDGSLSWPIEELPPVTAPGYGTDPFLVNPQPVPWPTTLNDQQLAKFDRLAELICPGASEAAVVEALDEWISAPYPRQASDRELLINGLRWLEQFVPANQGYTMDELDDQDLVALLAALEASPPTPEYLEFVERLRYLVAGLYFSSPAGVHELGYQGNVALSGDYPGPNPEAMEHLEQLLAKLDLELPDAVKY